MILTISAIIYLMVSFIAVMSRYIVVRFQIMEDFIVFVHIKLLIPNYIEILKEKGYENSLQSYTRAAKKFMKNVNQLFKNKNNF